MQFQYAIKLICRHILVHSWTFLHCVHCTPSVVLCITLSLAQYEHFCCVQRCKTLFSWQSTTQPLCAVFRVGHGGVRRKRPLSLLHCHLTLLWVTPDLQRLTISHENKEATTRFSIVSDDFAMIFHLPLLWVTPTIYKETINTRRTERQQRDFPWFFWWFRAYLFICLFSESQRDSRGYYIPLLLGAIVLIGMKYEL